MGGSEVGGLRMENTVDEVGYCRSKHFRTILLWRLNFENVIRRKE